MKKLGKTRLSDQAALAIKRLIADGTHPLGSRLPTEAELANELGVTRLTVREALAQLEAAGLTATRHGSGTYVTDFDERITLRLRAEMLAAGRGLTPAEALSLMEFRAIVIDAFAAPLAKNASVADCAALRNILALERAVVGRPEELAELDHRFNETLARASQNLFFPMLVRSMREIHVHLGTVIFRELGDDAAIIAAQEAIVVALEAKSLAKLRRALGIYLVSGTAVVRRWLARGSTRHPVEPKAERR